MEFWSYPTFYSTLRDKMPAEMRDPTVFRDAVTASMIVQGDPQVTALVAQPDEFPPIAQDRRLRSPSPIQGVMQRTGALPGEPRHQVDALDSLIHRRLSHGQHRGRGVQRPHRLVDHLAGRNRPGPSGDERHSLAAVGLHALFADQRHVERTDIVALDQRRAVVADLENQRALRQAQILELLAKHSDPVIHRQKRSQCHAANLWLDMLQPRHVLRRTFDRRMRCEVAKQQEERRIVLLAAIEERQRGSSPNVDAIVRITERLVPARHVAAFQIERGVILLHVAREHLGAAKVRAGCRPGQTRSDASR
jgi:hypothetical protein